MFNQVFWEVLRCDDLSLQVDTSLQNGFAPGMKLEVAVKSDQNTYWVATIITTCGQLLLLRYDGYGEDRKADFWCDIMTADLHPIGWCEQNKKILKVPEGNASMCRRGECDKVGLSAVFSRNPMAYSLWILFLHQRELLA